MRLQSKKYSSGIHEQWKDRNTAVNVLWVKYWSYNPCVCVVTVLASLPWIWDELAVRFSSWRLRTVIPFQCLVTTINRSTRLLRLLEISCFPDACTTTQERLNIVNALLKICDSIANGHMNSNDLSLKAFRIWMKFSIYHTKRKTSYLL